MSHRAKIRRDDLVKVIAGKDKGKTGKVLRVDIEEATRSSSRASTSRSATSGR